MERNSEILQVKEGLYLLHELVWKNLPSHKRRIIVFSVASVIVALSDGLAMASILSIFDDNSTVEEFATSLGVHDLVPEGQNQLLVILSIVLAVSGLKFAVMWGTVRLSYSIGLELAAKLHLSLLSQKYERHNIEGSTKNVVATFSLVNTAIAYILNAMLLTTHVMVAVATLTVLFLHERLVIFASAAVVFVYIIFGKRLKKSMLRNGQIITTKSYESMEIIKDSLLSIREIKLYRLECQVNAAYTKIDSTLRRAMGYNVILAGLPRHLVESLVFTLLFIYFWLSGSVNEPALGVMLIGVVRLLPSIQTIYGAWSSNVGSSPMVREVLSRLDLGAIERLKESPIYDVKNLSEIRFSNILCTRGEQGSFSVSFSLTLRSGDRILFAGNSGAGKSTVLDLMSGLLEYGSGHVTINNVEIPRHSLDQMRSFTAYVSQAGFLTDSTIRDNILFGIPDDELNAISKRIPEICRIVGIDEGHGKVGISLETRVGELGSWISGGQRQRVLLARALIREPKLLLLDESTTQLDQVAEEFIVRKIMERYPDLILVFVTHRPIDPRLFSRSIKIDNGVVSERDIV